MNAFDDSMEEKEARLWMITEFQEQTRIGQLPDDAYFCNARSWSYQVMHNTNFDVAVSRACFPEKYGHLPGNLR